MLNVQVSATSGAAVPHLQSRLLDWALQKRDLVQQEAEDLQAARAQAVRNKWSPHALKRAADKAVKRVEYYKKVVLALEAGYCLFPTGSIDLFAVRTERRKPDYGLTQGTDDTSRDREAKAQALPAGKGRYVSNELLVLQRGAKVKTDRWDHASQTYISQTVDGHEYFNEAFEDVEFPLELAKPELMRITSEAMALKFFDEIGVLRVRADDTARVAKGDPVILGRIVYPFKQGWASHRKRLTFLIGWYVDTADL